MFNPIFIAYHIARLTSLLFDSHASRNNLMTKINEDLPDSKTQMKYYIISFGRNQQIRRSLKNVF